MKHTKKLLGLMLALIMAFALAAPAFAAGKVETGTITINKAVVGQTYKAYQILDLESYDTTTNAYSYKATADWKNFVEGTGIANVYLTTDSKGYVTWVSNASAADFAKLAQKYATDNKITPQGKEKATSTTVTFSGLDLGYYLVDSTLGTLCSLDTTNPNVTMNEKNAEPTITKEVQEDDGSTWGPSNSAEIGQTINFRSTIAAQAGAAGYVFSDTMSAGLTFGSVTGITLNGKTVDNTGDKNYVVKVGDATSTKCTFEVVFTQAFCDTLNANDQIVISYTAALNENAKIVGDTDTIPNNTNSSRLVYGEEGRAQTEPATTTTKTYRVIVKKYGNNDKTNVLEGAKFVLLNSDKTKVATVVNNKLTGWTTNTNPTDASAWPANTVLTTGTDGQITINGLDRGDTYYLREVEAPAGYNVLADDTTVTLSGEENKEFTIEINNQSGTELPETGGMGTTIFYAVGGILVLAAVVLLVTKKRMGARN